MSLKVRVRAVDETGTPVSGANVRNGGEIVATTDESGVATVDIDTGFDSLTVPFDAWAMESGRFDKSGWTRRQMEELDLALTSPTDADEAVDVQGSGPTRAGAGTTSATNAQRDRADVVSSMRVGDTTAEP